jgi:hypothetical protein
MRGYGTNGAVFLVAMSKDAQGAYHQRLHALDLTTGAELGVARLKYKPRILTTATDPATECRYSLRGNMRSGWACC